MVESIAVVSFDHLCLGPKEIPRSNVRLTRELGTCVYGPIWDAEVILKPGFTSRCLIKVCHVHILCQFDSCNPFTLQGFECLRLWSGSCRKCQQS